MSIWSSALMVAAVWWRRRRRAGAARQQEARSLVDRTSIGQSIALPRRGRRVAFVAVAARSAMLRLTRASRGPSARAHCARRRRKSSSRAAPLDDGAVLATTCLSTWPGLSSTVPGTSPRPLRVGAHHFGGEITTYTELLNEARAEALLRLKMSAASEGATAVLAVRISTTSLPGGASELLAYGSAVKLS